MACEPATTATRDDKRLRFERSPEEEAVLVLAGAAEAGACGGLWVGFCVGLVSAGAADDPLEPPDEDSEWAPGDGVPEVR